MRYTLATLMLDNGADLRYVQDMVGHAVISTTEIYTHVSIAKLKRIHSMTHPTLYRAAEKNKLHEATVEDVMTALADEVKEKT